MLLTMKELQREHWEEVAKIYKEGIETETATFQTDIPSWGEWDNSHIKQCRMVALLEGNVVGWVALSPISSRCVYRGVAEVSIYVSMNYQNRKIGTKLLKELNVQSEQYGFWTLQSSVFEQNVQSLVMHRNCGFRVVGTREKIGKTSTGIWRNVVLLERRSAIVGF
ncbi:N-acetyltransferase [Alkaliphilus pronyensis]|uniref:N-acetyltransferase n=1 Tax=Alkaliphilus pronyensis TaxID=1482732 RepID=A0A6I0EXA8_9FIRM|nr:GNAT family N-acetyltransferase [Alkaliphilus pronyensis]KAB3531615.1 N-acetyltransferase [Alkaliphilus pronyensis]